MEKPFYRFLFTLVISVLRKSVVSSSFEDESEISVVRDGDIVFAALFPLYRKDSNGKCVVLNKDSLLWIKTLNFALNELENTQNPLLQNVTFGFHLRDTCSKPALEHSLDILYNNKRTKPIQRSSKKVIAVLTSYIDADASTLLSLFKIPQIMFSEQIYEMPGAFPKQHPYFFESIKTSYYRAKALVGLVKYFQWKSVSLVVKQPYHKDYLIFKQLAEMESICIAMAMENFTFDKQDSSAHDSLMQRFGHALRVRVVLLFADDMDTLRLIRAVQEIKPSHFTWVDAMGSTKSVTQELSRTEESVLSLYPEYMFLEKIKNHVYSECKKKGSAPSSEDRDLPRQVDPCAIEVSSNGILDETLENIVSEKTWDPRTRMAYNRAKDVQGIVNGAFLVGHGVAQYMGANCLDRTKEECFEDFKTHALASKMQVLVKTFFQRDFSHAEKPHKLLLKENLFSLMSIHGNSSGVSSRAVGTWDKNWYINRAGIHWPGRSSETPDSTCAPACPVGHVQVAEQGRKCCWSCQPCSYNQYITNNYTCADCVRGYWPSKDFSSCEFKLQVTLLSCVMAISSVAAVLYSLVL